MPVGLTDLEIPSVGKLRRICTQPVSFVVASVVFDARRIAVFTAVSPTLTVYHTEYGVALRAASVTCVLSARARVVIPAPVIESICTKPGAPAFAAIRL